MKKIALACGGILLALALAEVLLRITDLGAVRPQLRFDTHTQALLSDGSFVTDRRLLWRQGDGPRAPLEKQYRIVHPSDPAPAKTGRFRIICLGDSCTRLSGQGPPYTAILEQELDPRRVEVFNASLPGYTSHQGLAWLETQLLDFAPDLVVVYFGWNDHWRSTGRTDRQLAADLAARRPRLWRLLQRPAQPPPLRVSTAEYAENLRRVADLVTRRGGQVLLLTAPYHFTAENIARIMATGYLLAGDEPGALHEQYLDVVRSLGGLPGVSLFDAAELFASVQAPRLLLQRDGIHLRESGHVALAAMLAPLIAHRHLGAPAPPAPPLATLQTYVAQLLAREGHWAASLQRYRQAHEAAPAAAGPRLGLAWLLATSPDAAQRDGAAALALLADGADELAAAAGPQFHDIRAAALAEAGRFAEAVAVMDLALAQLEAQERAPAEMTAAFRLRQDLYRRGQPYRLE